MEDLIIATRIRRFMCGVLFFLGVCTLLLLDTRFYDRGWVAIGFWTASVILLVPDVLKSRFMPTVIALFIVGLLIVLGKSLPERLKHQEAMDRVIERIRGR